METFKDVAADVLANFAVAFKHRKVVLDALRIQSRDKKDRKKKRCEITAEEAVDKHIEM